MPKTASTCRLTPAPSRPLSTPISQARPALASVLVTHQLEELPASTTHAALIRDGAFTAVGPVARVLTTELVSEAFRHPITIVRDAGRWLARSASAPTAG